MTDFRTDLIRRLNDTLATAVLSGVPVQSAAAIAIGFLARRAASVRGPKMIAASLRKLASDLEGI